MKRKRRALRLESLERRRLLTVDLVADIYAGEMSSSPSELTPLDDRLLFAAENEVAGEELWVTDAATNETQLVLDIRPGAESSHPHKLIQSGERVFFFADDGEHGRELWVTQGDADSTRLVKDIREGATPIQVGEVVASDSFLYFVSLHESKYELWRSDGTDAGTILLVALDHQITDLAVTVDTLFFNTQTGDEEAKRLWTSDATIEGTVSLPVTEGLEILFFSATEDELYFATQQSVWESDGTNEGTQQVAEIPTQYFVNDLFVASDVISFRECSENRPSSCNWKTIAGQSVPDVSTFTEEPSSNAPFFFNSREHLFDNVAWQKVGDEWAVAGQFRESNNDHTTGVWLTDLTPDGTRLIPGTETVPAGLQEMAIIDSTLFFSVEVDSAIGQELYKVEVATESQTVEFSQAFFEVSEDGSTTGSEVTVTRSSGVGRESVAVSVHLDSVEEHDDIVGFAWLLDLDAQQYIVDFEEGETSKTISFSARSAAEVDARELFHISREQSADLHAILTLYDDTQSENTESLTLRLWPISTDMVPTGVVEATINVIDDDQPEILLNHTDSSTAIMVGGTADEVAVSLNFQPDNRVVVRPLNDPSFTVTPEQLEFTAANWSEPQRFRVEGRQPGDAELVAVIDLTVSESIARDTSPSKLSFSIESPIEFEQVSSSLSVANINAKLGQASEPHDRARVFVEFNDTVYFVADDGKTPGMQLWATDSDEDQAVLHFVPPTPSFSVRNPVSTSRRLLTFIPYGDELLFTHHYSFVTDANTGIDDFELWRTDTESEATELLLPRYHTYTAEIEGVDHGPLFHAVGPDGSLYMDYATYDGEVAQEFALDGLWLPSQFVTIDDRMFFTATASGERQLFVTSDGFETYQRLSPEESGQLLRANWILRVLNSELVPFQGQLYYSATVKPRQTTRDNDFDDNHVTELWRSDGTVDGTIPISKPRDGHVSNLTVVGEKLFFTTNQPHQLFVTDGTESGTVLLQEFDQLGNRLSDEFGDLDHARDTTDFVALDDVLYFAAGEGEDWELWRSDGTIAGTQLVKDINPGELGSEPTHLTVVGDRLYFVANDGESGRELWMTDGTAEGTQLAADVYVGESSSNPDHLTVASDRLYFVADDGIRGREVWRFDTNVQDTDELLGDVNGDLEVNFVDFLILSSNFGSETMQGTSDGDLNRNGLVDFVDFLLLSENFGRKLESVSTSSGGF